MSHFLWDCPPAGGFECFTDHAVQYLLVLSAGGATTLTSPKLTVTKPTKSSTLPVSIRMWPRLIGRFALVHLHASSRLFSEASLHNGGESVTNLALKELQANKAGGDTVPLHQRRTPVKSSSIVITSVHRVRLINEEIPYKGNMKVLGLLDIFNVRTIKSLEVLYFLKTQPTSNQYFSPELTQSFWSQRCINSLYSKLCCFILIMQLGTDLQSMVTHWSYQPSNEAHSRIKRP